MNSETFTIIVVTAVVVCALMSTRTMDCFLRLLAVVLLPVWLPVGIIVIAICAMIAPVVERRRAATWKRWVKVKR